MKGDSSCHIPNDRYRGNYDKTFAGRQQNTIACAGCGIRIPVDETSPESLCAACKEQLKNQKCSWQKEE